MFLLFRMDLGLNSILNWVKIYPQAKKSSYRPKIWPKLKALQYVFGFAGQRQSFAYGAGLDYKTQIVN